MTMYLFIYAGTKEDQQEIYLDKLIIPAVPISNTYHCNIWEVRIRKEERREEERRGQRKEERRGYILISVKVCDSQ